MSSLRDAIARTVSQPRRLPSWLDRVPDDVRAELLEIRREWRDGTLQATGRGLAAAIVANCRERGIPCLEYSGVREWLTRGA